MVRAGLIFAAVLAVVIVAPTAGAAAPRAGSYVGTPSRGGTITLSIAPGGRRIATFSVAGVARRGDHCDSDRYSARAADLKVDPRGRFAGGYSGDVILQVRGAISTSGRIRGRLRYGDRGGCFTADAFAARFERGLAGHGARVFTLYGGDGSLPARQVPATRAGRGPNAVTELPSGSLVIADSPDSTFAAIVGVSPFGRASRLAGGTGEGLSGDGGPAAKATLSYPQDVAALPDGGYLIADTGNGCVRRVDAAGIITRVAGICTESVDAPTTPIGDGGLATSARLGYPDGLAVLPGGAFLVADATQNRVREVSPGGVISTVAGTGQDGFSGDGGPATAARMSGPSAVVALPRGGFLVADAGNDRAREVRADGTISTVAGGGTTSLARGIGDGGPATAAVLIDPLGVAALPDGGFVISDAGLERIRGVAPDGTITTLAGGGPLGLGAVAANAGAGIPGHLQALSDGGVAFVDGYRGTIDELAPAGTTRLLIALQPAAASARAGRPVGVRLIATRGAQLTVDVIGRHHRRVRRTHARARPGTTRLRLGGLVSGTYRVRITARAGRRVGTASVRLRVR